MGFLGLYSSSNYGWLNVRFGSLAAPQDSTIPMAASGGKAVVQQTICDSHILNVCFSRKRTFNQSERHGIEGRLSAKSGQCSSLLGVTGCYTSHLILADTGDPRSRQEPKMLRRHRGPIKIFPRGHRQSNEISKEEFRNQSMREAGAAHNYCPQMQTRHIQQ